jgi:hypothetical protein
MGQHRRDFCLPDRADHVELEEVTMQTQSSRSNQKSIKWNFLLVFNIVVLSLFWFGIFTDYSWSSGWIKIIFPAITSFVSLITFFMMKGMNKFQLLLIFLLCMLSFLVATLTTLFKFVTGSYTNQIPVQVESSPDGIRVVEVYCSTNNAHGGMDHIEVKVKNINFPFLERDFGVYNNYPSRKCKFDVDSLVYWEDNNTIYVIERRAYLSVDNVKGEGVLFNPGEIHGTK